MTTSFRATARAHLARGGLYAIVDVDASHGRALDWLEVGRAVVAGGARVVQLRAKGRPDDFVVEGLRALRRCIPRGSGCLLFANDRPDLAEEADADGVHVGQGDAPVEEVRARHPRLALGVSTHDEAQLARALDAELDYVALGPIFPTDSKRDAEPVVGLALLERAGSRARARGVPLVAIGGIHRENLHAVRAHARLWATIGALLPERGETLEPYVEVERRARALAQPG